MDTEDIQEVIFGDESVQVDSVLTNVSRPEFASTMGKLK